MTIEDLLPALSGRHGDHRDAVRVGTDACSWAELRERSDRLATNLVGATAVALPAVASLDTIVGLVAAFTAGVPVVPVATDAGPVERAHVLDSSGADLVLGDPDWSEVTLPRRPIDAASRGSGGPPPDAAARLVVYTSGTTGPPKGAVLPGTAIAADLDGLADAWGWTPDDTLVHGLPLFHVHGLVLGVLGALRVGSKLVHTVRPTPEAYAAAGGTLYFGVPTVWSRVAADPSAATALRPARLLVSGSAALPVPVFERLHELAGHRPIERYGMTETLITLSTRAEGERRPGSVGVALSGVETRLLGDDGSDAPHDGATIGSLLVRGATLFEGYLGRPDATAASFTGDGWFVTGDSATIGPDGFHRIAGRSSSDIIKTGGYKVGAGEVETVLLGHPGVSEAAVVGVPDDDLGQRIVAYCVAEGVSGTELVAFVAERLSVHKRPREVVLRDALPRNAMGKVVKSRLG